MAGIPTCISILGAEMLRLHPTKVGVVLISPSGAAKAIFRAGGVFQSLDFLDGTPDQSSTSELAIYQQPKILSGDMDVLYINIGFLEGARIA
jgi:hypothetical protein